MATVRIPPVLRRHTNGDKELQVAGNTVGQILTELAERYPAIDHQLFQDGQLHRFVNVYLNDQDVQYLQKLDTPVAPDDTIIILPAMAGGGDAVKGAHPTDAILPLARSAGTVDD